MIAQLFTFLFCSLCFIVIGALLKKVTKWIISYYHDFLIGFACSNGFFTLASIFFPVNLTILYIFLLIIIVIVFINRNWLSSYFEKMFRVFSLKITNNIFIFSLIGVFIIISFFQSLYSPSLHYDAALYHIPAIKWAAEYPTIPGLANLNIVLGYNFNIHPLYAAFSFERLFNQAIYAINFTIVCFFCLWLFSIIDHSIQSKQYLFVLTILLIIYYLIMYYWPHISTTSNDILVYILVVTVLLSYISYKFNKDSVYFVVILSIYALTLKLSSGPILLLAIYYFTTKQYWQDKRKAAITTLISSFILVPWLIKNVIITGWILFPFPHLNFFSFDWQVPLSYVTHQKVVIDTYYLPKKMNIGEPQIRSWFFTQSILDILTMMIAFVMLSIISVKLLTKKVMTNQFYIAPITVSAAGILFMFVSAPSLRYCISFFVASIALCVNILDIRTINNGCIFYSISALLFIVFLKDNWFHPWHFVKNINQRLLVPYPLVTTSLPKFSYFLIDNNIKCYYPIGTDQCFEHALPCTSHLINYVHLRGKTIEKGFYTAVLSK